MYNLSEHKSPLLTSAWNRLDFTVADRQRPTVLWMACDDSEQQQTARERLCARYGETYRHVVCDLDEWQEGELTAYLERAIASEVRDSEPCRYMVHLAGFDNKLAEEDPSDAPNPFLQTINFEREQLFDRFPFLTVFWTTPATQCQTQRLAPDFWDWVTNKFWLGEGETK